MFYVKSYLGGSDITRNIIEANLVAIEPINNITLDLPENFADVKVEDVGGVKLNTNIVNNKLTINFEELEKGKSIFFKITYFTDESITFANSNSLFSYAFMPHSRIKDFRFTVFLPLKATIITKNGISLISPEGEITSDGERIVLKYKTSLEKEEEFSSFVAYRLERDYRNYFLFVFGIIFGGLLTWYLLSRKNKKIIKKKTTEMLEEDEQYVYDFVYEKDGIMQTEIIEKTNFSKAKVSKILRNLEKKRIIRKEPYKKTNKVFIQ